MNTLFVLDAVDTSGTWIREGDSLTLLGDILADRNEHGLEIVNRIASLRSQIEATGGELNVVAGNHDIFALEYLGGHAGSVDQQRAGYRELFRLAKGREPADDVELMKLPRREDFIEILQSKKEGKPLLDFFTSLDPFHVVEHEGGNNTLLLHAPPREEVLAKLLSSSAADLSRVFQESIRAYLANEAGPLFPTVLSDEFKAFQWGNWYECPNESDPLWTELHKQRGIWRVICGHRKSDQVVRCFGPIEAVALDRNFGMFPRISHPDCWNGAVSGGTLDKKGVFRF